MANRETTLAAMAVCLGKLMVSRPADAGVKLAERNRPAEQEIAATDRPYIGMRDGDDGVENDEVLLRGTMARSGAAALDDLECEIIGQLEAPQADVGTLLNDLIAAVIKLLATDADLGGVLGSQGKIVKKVTVVDFWSSENVVGQFRMTLGVKYVLKPADPASA